MTQDETATSTHFERLQFPEWETAGYYWEFLRKQMLQKGADLVNDVNSKPHERAIGKIYQETAQAMLGAKGVLTAEICRQHPDKTTMERRSIFDWW